MSSGGNVEGTSNTGRDAIAVDHPQSSNVPQFDNIKILSNYTYGVGDFDPSYVPERQNNRKYRKRQMEMEK